MPQPFEQPAEPGQGRPDVSASASVEKTFVVSGSCRFSLDNPCGRVRIVGWDQATRCTRGLFSIRQQRSPTGAP
jgi:hypothetical protein